MIIIDTNVALTQYLIGVRLVRYHQKSQLCISVMSQVELLSISDSIVLSSARLFLSTVTIISLDEQIISRAADLRRMWRLKTVDAIIAATALSLSMPLKTMDKIFYRVKGLRLI